MELVNSPTETALTALILSLVNGLYKITTESIELVLDVEQFGMRTDLIVIALNVQKVSYVFFYASLLRPSKDSTDIH